MDANPAAEVPFVDEAALEKKFRAGASWFFWIAGLSVANTALQLADSDRSFLVGLASTQVVDAIAGVLVRDGAPALLRWVAFALDAGIAGLFVAFGVLSRKRPWAYVVGLALYVADGLVAAAFQDWPMAGFHAFALVSLVGGYVALRKLRAATATPALATAPAADPMRPNRLVR